MAALCHGTLLWDPRRMSVAPGFLKQLISAVVGANGAAAIIQGVVLY